MAVCFSKGWGRADQEVATRCMQVETAGLNEDIEFRHAGDPCNALLAWQLQDS